ncbi:hypothetical protein [uncultured Helicobacter sp.]|uniref:hypothetical protein n=1 Tax=uncultured Helicobacter sp. TaxID=175537 RepID=UPI0026054938|nr:hypothetical protein [uncultured Helicobacter sp.]
MSKPVVYIVHCIDTAGPLDQSTQAICELLQSTFGIAVQTKEEISALQKGNFNVLLRGAAHTLIMVVDLEGLFLILNNTNVYNMAATLHNPVLITYQTTIPISM